MSVEYYYDELTGETKLIANSETHFVKSYEEQAAQQAYAIRQKAIERGPTLNYVSCYHEPLKELNAILNVNELGAIMKLIPYIRMNTEGRLIYKSKPMTANLASKAIGKAIKQTRSILASLEESDVIYREKVGRSFVYGVTERYHRMGSVMKGALYTKVLQVKTRTDIRNLSIEAAGVFYKMLPFFNYEHFVLCTNVNEPNISEIHPLSHRKFAELVGVDRGVINRGVRELIRYGFIGTFRAFNGELYRVNPDVATRRPDMFDEVSERVRQDFRMAYEVGVEIEDGDLPF